MEIRRPNQMYNPLLLLPTQGEREREEKIKDYEHLISKSIYDNTGIERRVA